MRLALPLHPPHRLMCETIEGDARRDIYPDALAFHEAWISAKSAVAA